MVEVARTLCLLAMLASCGRVNFEPVTIDAAPQVTCGPSYQPAANLTSLYRRGTGADWFQAELDCESDGGHLVVIDSQIENDHVLSLTVSEVWIGLSDHTTEGTMVWVTGRPLTFDNFKDLEPNDQDGEDCVHFKSDGGWNDVACKSGLIDFVCECDLVPAEPATHCDTETLTDCGECGTTCSNNNCNGQVCSGGGA
jgi:hypothetical protein